ncbi:hypothetical protein GR927_04680 [Mycolicibacterium sp. 3033]|nr:hypothetical protein [Mycolicibacterium aurantiacum]
MFEDPDSDDPPPSDESANAGLLDTANPSPNATASAPTRDTYFADSISSDPSPNTHQQTT